MSYEEVLAEMEEALEKARRGFEKMMEAKSLLLEADKAISISALKCEIMADRGDESFKEMMDDADLMKSIVSYTLKNWPNYNSNK